MDKRRAQLKEMEEKKKEKARLARLKDEVAQASLEKEYVTIEKTEKRGGGRTKKNREAGGDVCIVERKVEHVRRCICTCLSSSPSHPASHHSSHHYSHPFSLPSSSPQVWTDGGGGLE